MSDCKAVTHAPRTSPPSQGVGVLTRSRAHDRGGGALTSPHGVWGMGLCKAQTHAPRISFSLPLQGGGQGWGLLSALLLALLAACAAAPPPVPPATPTVPPPPTATAVPRAISVTLDITYTVALQPNVAAQALDIY